MKLITTLTALLTALVTLITAQQATTQHGAGIYITNPVLGTKINGGSTHTITWDITDASVTNLEAIELRNGETNNLKHVDTISSKSIPISDKKFEWIVSPNITTGTSYVLVAKSAAGVSYSAYFTIFGMSPGIGASGDAATNSTSTSPSSTILPVVSSGSSSIPVFNDYITAAAASTPSLSQTNTLNAPLASGSHRINSTSVACNTFKSGMFGLAGAIGMTILLA